MDQPISTLTYSYSAPGKVILSGEHSVVYGMPCIAFSVDLRTHAQITMKAARATSNQLQVNLVDLNSLTEYSWSDILLKKQENLDIVKNMNNGKPFDTMVEMLRKIAYDVVPNPKQENLQSLSNLLKESYETTITIKSQIPFNSGMGSSASVSVALSAVLLQFFTTVSSRLLKSTAQLFNSTDEFKNCVNDFSYYGEKLIHGSPSGVDNCVIVRGGIISFTKTPNGGIYEKISDKPNFLFCIMNSHTKRFTSEIIKKVRSIKECFPKLFTTLINSIKECTLNMLDIIKKQTLSEPDEDKLMNLVKMNHKMLSSLLITHPNLENVIRICEKHSISAKLTGAGLGGSVVGLMKKCDFEKDVEMVNNLKEDLTNHGFSLMTTQSDHIGLKEEMLVLE